mmetsp:Transcript_12025/g.21873  ORF Transcript_12025/g.21873 Transcript_12025/m.21873 type:complete len:263 (-) Transcript_12025:150-938(-)|eukprot:CAMPEP_0202482020 /NCGR_PEP_ID=MMETSP1361-20130828/1480_1 /ASSEMBLY_ACC=CAM_ASM_000849 /TAXON_ID=210615 /ORGANISM="Staurosira complex sp., Strain CCMP2646" /LENGTH=262 /DNA_ID=CAMNT_0049109725 /DNA_START=44 /DNA_END=832 /DNA_ORIENTATION=+
MSSTRSETHTHRSKDGLYYPSYQEMAHANIKFNKLHLEKIGLGESYQNRNKSNTPKKKKKAPVVTPPSSELRRSNRVRKEKPEFELLPETFVEPRKRTKTNTPGSRSNAQRKLEQEELEALKNVPDWLDGFETFLLTVPHGGNGKVVSRDNARCVMRQTRLLVAGLGIEYHRWDEGVVWKKGVKVDLGMDFDALFQEAIEHEGKYGRDLGNGWLMRHPIRKLQCYQEYLANKNKNDESEENMNGQEEEEKKEEAAVASAAQN